MTSPEASSKPPEKPADAPPSGAALSDKARMKLLKQLQTQENKLQKLLAKSGEIESIEALRKAVEKETLFEPAIACLKKQAGIAAELKGIFDQKSFVEKAERLEALEKVFIKNLANGGDLTLTADALQKQFSEALSPPKLAEQAAASPDANASAAPAAASSPEPTKTADTPAKPTSIHSESLKILKNLREEVLADEKAKVQAQLDAIGAGREQTGKEIPPVPAAAPEAAKSEEKIPPPLASGPAAANSEQAKPAQKQNGNGNGNGNGNRTRPTILERVQQEAKGFEQGLAIPLVPAGAKETSPPTADMPSQKEVEQQTGAKKASETTPRTEKPPRAVKSSGSQDALARIMRDVEKSGVLKRRRGTGEVVVKGRQVATEIERLVRVFESEEFNEKNAAERERTIRDSVALLTTNERLRRDLLSAFEQKGWLTKSEKAESNAKKEEVEQKTTPAPPEVTPSQPPPKPLETPPANAEQPKSSEAAKEKSAEALLHQVLTDVGRVPAGETIPRRMPDGKVVGVSGKNMAAELQKVIKTYQTLEFPKKTLKERREIVLRDIDNTTSHPLLRADLERAFAAKGWLPQVVEPMKTAVETKTAEPKPPVETEPKKTEPMPVPEKTAVGTTPEKLTVEVLRTLIKEHPDTMSKAARGFLETPPKDAPATLAGNPPPKESTPATPPSTPPPAAEKTPVPEPSVKTKPSLAELIRARVQGGSAPVTASFQRPSVEKMTPPPAVAPAVEKAAPIPTATPTEKTATPQSAKTGPSLAELLRERARGGAKKEFAPIPPNPSVPSRTEAISAQPSEGTAIPVPKLSEAVSAFKAVETPPIKLSMTDAEAEAILKARPGRRERTDFTLEQTKGLKIGDMVMLHFQNKDQWTRPAKIIRFEELEGEPGRAYAFTDNDEGWYVSALVKQDKSAPKGPTPEQQKVLTFENLATWSKEDLAKLAAAVPDEAVWAVALQGMTTSALEKAVQAALPPERVDNFALEILTMPIKPKQEIEAKQQVIIAEAQKLLAAKTGKES